MTEKLTIEDLNSDYNTAQYFYENTKETFVCADLGTKKLCYYWNPKTTLYEPMVIDEISHKIRQHITPEITKLLDVRKAQQYKTLTKLLAKIGSQAFINNVTKSYCVLIYDPKFLSKLDVIPDEMNFKNGLVSLKTGEFRARINTDYVSKCLPYNYSKEEDLKIKKQLETMIFNICNDNKEDYDFNLSFFGYCLTGETKEEVLLYIVGYKASNGKSTLVKTMFAKAFPVYSYQIDKRTFTETYSKQHKQYANIKAPVRLTYINECDDQKADEDRIKEFTDAEVNNEIMFGTSEVLKLFTKLIIIGNRHPKVNSDEGLLRRGLLSNFKNKFVEKEVYDSLPNKAGHHIMNKDIGELMLRPEYGLAFFQILLPYAMQYYKKGLVGKTKYNQEWKQLFKENDKMKTFIDTFYEQTGDDKDRIHKDEFLREYRTFAEQLNLSWFTLLNDVNRVGLTYARQTRKKGFATQGCITGLKLKEKVDYDDELPKVPKKQQKNKYEQYAFTDPLDNGINTTEQAVIIEEKKPSTPTKKKMTIKSKHDKTEEDEQADHIIDFFNI